MKRTPFFLLLTLLSLFIACDDLPEDNTPAPVSEKIPIKISTIVTKATETAFESGDAVGLYVVNRNGSTAVGLANSGNHADNACFHFDGSVWSASSPLYWKDQQTHADFYCYYPYKSSITDVRAVPVSVKTNQSEIANYYSSEFLWGKVEDVIPSQNPVQIITHHSFSNLLIYLEAGNGYTQDGLTNDVSSIRINNTRVSGTISLVDGKVTANGEPVDITPLREGDHYRAMIIPQAVNDVTLISVVVDGYSFSLKQSLTFEPNKQHKCTIKINKTSEGINIGIGAWETDDTDYGGTVN